jgi:SAM-dependent methyltransferase
VALVHAGSGFLGAVGEQLAAPGLAVEQLAQEAGDFAFTRAGVEQSPACARWKRDEPGSRSFRHVRWVGVKPTFFNACKSHVCILRVNDPQEDASPRGARGPRGLVQFIKTDLNLYFPYKSNCFERVALIHVIYALKNPTGTLSEIFRVLRPNGRVVIVNPRKNASVSSVIKANLILVAPKKRIPFLIKLSFVIILNMLIAKAAKRGYYHFWTEQDWAQNLYQIGFTEVFISPVYADQSFLIIAKKE